MCQTNFANCLTNALHERQQIIFNNSAMLSAIFLDPRYRNEISNDTNLRDQAIQTLLNLWRRLNRLNETINETMDETMNDTTKNFSKESFGSDIANIDFDDHSIVDEYMSKSNQSQSLEPATNIPNLHIEAALELFQPEKTSQAVIEYWVENKSQHPDLYKLAMVVYGIPPAETQIERDFSALQFIIGQRRHSLSHEQVEAILTIFLNPDIFYIIRNEKLLNN